VAPKVHFDHVGKRKSSTLPMFELRRLPRPVAILRYNKRHHIDLNLTCLQSESFYLFMHALDDTNIYFTTFNSMDLEFLT
jgi:hypothetical protein